MPIKKAPEEVTTKTGELVTTNYCRKCMKLRPAKEFYECVDAGFVDKNGLFSVCKDCVQDIYDEVYGQLGSIEKTLHKVCTTLNVMFSNDAVEATKTHINTLLEGGKTVTAIFSIYKMKLTATKKSMDKSGLEDLTYADVGTIFTTEALNTKETAIPKSVVDFWGAGYARGDIEFLETEYTNFCQSGKPGGYPEIVLLKEVCYTLLQIKKLRDANDPDVGQALKELQALMKSLAISPKDAVATNGDDVYLGGWIKDVEQFEPCEWMQSDPRGDIYRDVADTENYWQKYFVRPIKNLITQSKDFNTEDEVDAYDELDNTDFAGIDDGEIDEA